MFYKTWLDNIWVYVILVAQWLQKIDNDDDDNLYQEDKAILKKKKKKNK